MLVLLYMLIEDILKSKANFLSPCTSGDSSTQPQPWILVWLRVSGIPAANMPPWSLGRCDSVISWHLMLAMKSWIPIRILFLRRNTFLLSRSSQYWAHPWFSKVSADGPSSSSSLCNGSFHSEDMSFCNSGMLFHDFFFCFLFMLLSLKSPFSLFPGPLSRCQT